VPLPSDALIVALRASDGLSEASVHGPRSQVVPPAVVIRPDEPWREPDRFCDDNQRYVAVAVARGASPEEAMTTLYDLTSAIIAGLPADWKFESVGAPVIDETTGVTLLAAPVRLSYANGAA
jgi:hypothetical protein